MGGQLCWSNEPQEVFALSDLLFYWAVVYRMGHAVHGRKAQIQHEYVGWLHDVSLGGLPNVLPPCHGLLQLEHPGVICICG